MATNRNRQLARGLILQSLLWSFSAFGAGEVAQPFNGITSLNIEIANQVQRYGLGSTFNVSGQCGISACKRHQRQQETLPDLATTELRCDFDNHETQISSMSSDGFGMHCDIAQRDAVIKLARQILKQRADSLITQQRSGTIRRWQQQIKMLDSVVRTRNTLESQQRQQELFNKIDHLQKQLQRGDS